MTNRALIGAKQRAATGRERGFGNEARHGSDLVAQLPRRYSSALGSRSSWPTDPPGCQPTPEQFPDSSDLPTKLSASPSRPNYRAAARPLAAVSADFGPISPPISHDAAPPRSSIAQALGPKGRAPVNFGSASTRCARLRAWLLTIGQRPLRDTPDLRLLMDCGGCDAAFTLGGRLDHAGAKAVALPPHSISARGIRRHLIVSSLAAIPWGGRLLSGGDLR